MKLFLLSVILYISFGFGSKVSFENFLPFVEKAKNNHYTHYGGRYFEKTISLTREFQTAAENFLNLNPAIEIMKAINNLDYKDISFFLFFWLHYRTGESIYYLPYAYMTSVQFEKALNAFLTFIKIQLYVLLDDERIQFIDSSLQIFYKIRKVYALTFSPKNLFFTELEREFHLLSQCRVSDEYDVLNDPYSLLLHEYSIFNSELSLPKTKSKFYFLIKYFLKKETEKTCDNVLIWLSYQRIEFIKCFLHLNYYNYVDKKMIDEVSRCNPQSIALFKSFNSIIPIFQFESASDKWIKKYNKDKVKLSDPYGMDHYFDIFLGILNQ
jgi:hypothetical protein